MGTVSIVRRRLRRDSVAVDHFVPWRRYPFDLALNFVLAHNRCNGHKGDRLAAVGRLRNWHDRDREYLYELPRRFQEAGLSHDWQASVRITRWAYEQVARMGGQVWIQGNELVRLEEGWELVLNSRGARHVEL